MNSRPSPRRRRRHERRPQPVEDYLYRLDQLPAPEPGQALPVLIIEKPKRTSVFPISAEEGQAVLQEFPEAQEHGATHFWLRRPESYDKHDGIPLAELICARGLRLVVIYPWPDDRRMSLGRAAPSANRTRELARYGTQPFEQRGRWFVGFDEQGLREFSKALLREEVARHLELYRNRPGRSKEGPDAAPYSVRFTKTGIEVVKALGRA